MPRSISHVLSASLLAGACLSLSFASARAQSPAGTPESTSIARVAGDPRFHAPRTAATSPGRALRIGLVSTLAPAAVGLLTPSRYGGVPNAAGGLFGAVLGGTLGPAVGLMAGGRSDLAYRGLLVRSAAIGIVGAVALASWDQPSQAGVGALVGGTAVVAVSSAYDLAITRRAVARGRGPHAGLVVRPDGALAVQLKF